MIRTVVIVAALLAGPVWAQDLPDPVLTPGAVNPLVNQSNIGSTICVSGWTKTIRPPASYTNALKARQMIARHLPGSAKDYEEDHAISLELGGDPRSEFNIWPEHWSEPWGARSKDAVETKLKHLVCSGVVSLEDAQHQISSDWIAAYKKYIGTEPH